MRVYDPDGLRTPFYFEKDQLLCGLVVERYRQTQQAEEVVLHRPA